MMNYNIKATDLTLSEEIRDYVEKRLAHTERFLHDDGTLQCGVELEYSSGAAGPKYRAEYTISIGQDVYRAEARGATLHEAVDIATDELKHELTRAKQKRLHVFRRQAKALKDFLRGWRE